MTRIQDIAKKNFINFGKGEESFKNKRELSYLNAVIFSNLNMEPSA